MTVTAGSDSAIASQEVPIAGAAIVPATSIPATENTPFSGAIGTVSDTASNLASATVTIDYGDNSGIVDGSLVNNGNGTYTIDAPPHTYTDGGSYNVIATVQESNGTTSTVDTPYQVSGPEILPNNNIPVTNGVVSATTEAIAAFNDPNPNNLATLGSSTASINWGDNTPSTPGSVQESSSFVNDMYVIFPSANHKYAEPGKYTISVTVTEPGGESSTLLEPIVVPIYNFQPTGITLSNPATLNANTQVEFLQNLASFNDSNIVNSGSSFIAIVDWGDGGATPDTSIANVSSNGSGGYNITGSHEYSTPGSYIATISLQDALGNTDSVKDTINVSQVLENQSISPAFSANLPAFNPNEISETATIYWGDTTSSTANIVTESTTGMVYLEPPAHTYAEAGTYDPSYTITVTTVAIVNGEPVFSSYTYPEASLNPVTVADAPLVPTTSPVTTFNVTTSEDLSNQSAPVTLAQFTDAGATSTNTADYIAIVNWGDGTTTINPITGVDTNGSIVFSVMGNHDYANVGTGVYDPVITIKDAGGSSVQIGDVVNVTPLAINEAFTTTLEVPLNFPFLDPITATVNWGDSTSPSTATYGEDLFDGLYNIFASHTYTKEGSYSPIVTITDTRTNQTIQETASPIEVSSFTLIPQTIPAVTEGQSLPNTIIALISDTNHTRGTTGYTVTGTWGDGASFTSADNVHLVGLGRVGSGLFDVEASHTAFSDEASGILSITVTDSNGASVTIYDSNPVTDIPLIGMSSSVNPVQEGVAFNNVTLASFTDPLNPTNPSNPNNQVLSDYSAMINWGDNTTSVAGTISYNAAGNDFIVQASHTYSVAGSFDPVITINDGINNSTIVKDSIQVNPSGVEGTPVVGSYNIGELQGFSGPFTATIFWGDNSQSAGVLLSTDVNGDLILPISHTYAEQGNYTISYDVLSNLAIVTSGTITASIADVPLSVTTKNINDVNASPTPFLIGTFTDPGANSSSLPSDYVATVTFNGASGSTILPGNDISIVADPSGQTSTYDVNVTIPYLPNDISYTLSVQEANNANTVATATGVFDPISTTPATLATTEGASTSFNLGTVQDQLFNSATINWEDGSQPQILPLNGSDQLIATHTYADAGNYSPVITIKNTLGTYTLQDSVAVNLAGTEGQAVTGALDLGLGFIFGTPSATVIWGDGQQSQNLSVQVDSNNDIFVNNLSHIYAEQGNYTITYDLYETLLQTTTLIETGTITANIADVPLSVTAKHINDVNASSTPFLVGTFTDPGANSSSLPSDYVATVTFNGSSGSTILPGNDISIVADPSGQTNTYDVNVTIPSLPNDSSFTLSVQEANNANTVATATGVFDPISTTPATLLATTEGVATQFNLGTVQDQLFNFATINWEDGSQPKSCP